MRNAGGTHRHEPRRGGDAARRRHPRRHLRRRRSPGRPPDGSRRWRRATAGSASRVPPGAQCTLAALPPMTTSTLVLRVAVDDTYDQADGSVGLVVSGAGISYRAPPIRLTVAASPARLALRTPAPALQLVSGRTRDVRAGRRQRRRQPADARHRLGHRGPAERRHRWTGTGREPVECTPRLGSLDVARPRRVGATLTCRIDTLAARTAAPLTLALTAGSPDAVGSRRAVGAAGARRTPGTRPERRDVLARPARDRSASPATRPRPSRSGRPRPPRSR